MPDDSILLGELAEQFSARVRQGQMPDVEEYAVAHPLIAARIRELFPTLMLLEGMAAGVQRQAPIVGELAAGEIFGAYRIEREIGRGGMGLVYQATHLALNKRVALKVLPIQGPRQAGQLERFLREAKTAAGLHHTNIVPVFDVGQVAGTPYYAMQFIDGRGLDRVLSDAQTPTAADATAPHPLPAHPLHRPRSSSPFLDPAASAADYHRWTSDVGIQAADGLAYAHQRGVIHRDVKPSNLLLDEQGVVWITDFGLARRQEDPALTHSGVLLGTPRYMSPEQAEATKRPVDHRTDIYSLGATLYELLTRRPAFDGQTPQEVVNQIIHRGPLSPRRLNPAVPRDLETIILRMMARRPEDRYQTAAEVADDLRRWQRLEPIRARRIGPAGRLVRWCRRNPAVAAMTAAVAILLIAVSLVSTLSAIQIGSARDAAERSADDERRARKEADDKSDESRQRLVRHYVSSGTRLMETGDLFGSLVWFCEAIANDRDKFRSTENHRTRLALILDQCPRLKQLWHLEKGIRHVEFSPDGQLVLAASGDGTAIIWDVQSGEEATPRMQFKTGLVSATFSPDGRRIFAVLDPWIENNKFICGFQVWDAATGRPAGPALRREGRNSGPAVFSPDGKLAATAISEDSPNEGAIDIWETATGKLLTTLRPKCFDIEHVAFSPDGKCLLAVCNPFFMDRGDIEPAGWTQVWDTSTWKPSLPPLKHNTRVWHAAFSPSRDRIATAGNDWTVRIWDAATGKPALPEPLLHGNRVNYVTFSPDGKYLLSAGGLGNAGEARLWDAADGRPRTPPLKHPGAVARAHFSPDGRRFVTVVADRVSARGEVRVWNRDGEPTTPPLQHAAPVTDATFGPDGRLLVAAGEDGVARVWDLAQVRPTVPSLSMSEPSYTRVEACEDHRRLFTISRDGTLRVWETATGNLAGPPQQPPEAWVRVSQSPDGIHALVGWGDVLRLRRTITGEEVDLVSWRTKDLDEDEFTPDSRHLLLVSNTPTRSHPRAQMFDVGTGTPIGPPIQPAKGLKTARPDPTGQRVVTTGPDSTVQVWNARTAEPFGPPLKPDPPLHGAAWFGPDGQLVICPSLRGFQTWDATTGRHLATIAIDPEEYLQTFSVSPDGMRLLTVSGPGNLLVCRTVQVWDTRTGQRCGRPIVHQGGVPVASFSPDSKRIVTAGFDWTARVWDAVTGQPLTPPLQHRSQVEASFSGDGRRVLTRDVDGLRLWDAATGEQLSPLIPCGWTSHWPVFTPEGNRLLLRHFHLPAQVLELSPTQKATEELLLLSEVLSGHRIDDTGGYVALDGTQQVEMWRAIRDRYYPPDKDAYHATDLDWHRQEAGVIEGHRLQRTIARPLSRWEEYMTGGRVSTLQVQDELLFHLDRLIEMEPARASWHAWRAEVLKHAQRPTEAVVEYTKAIELGGRDASVWSGRAEAYADMKKWKEAIADWSKAIEAAPHDFLLRDARAQAYGESGDYARAAQDLSKAGELDGRDESIWHELSVAYLAGGLAAEYRRTCEQRLRMVDKPGNLPTTARELQAWACVLAADAVADFDHVLQRAESAVTEQPKSATSLRTLGAAHFRMGKYESAEKRLCEALALQDDLLSAWLFLAMTQCRLGKKDEAQSSLSKAVRSINEQQKEEAATGQWVERAELHLLRREVEALLKKSKP
jgi:WD40 repeat protein/serine/threonine protein kinase/tetratricopeptide (TPR) repeat protein